MYSSIPIPVRGRRRVPCRNLGRFPCFLPCLHRFHCTSRRRAFPGRLFLDPRPVRRANQGRASSPVIPISNHFSPDAYIGRLIRASHALASLRACSACPWHTLACTSRTPAKSAGRATATATSPSSPSPFRSCLFSCPAPGRPPPAIASAVFSRHNAAASTAQSAADGGPACDHLALSTCPEKPRPSAPLAPMLSWPRPWSPAVNRGRPHWASYGLRKPPPSRRRHYYRTEHRPLPCSTLPCRRPSASRASRSS